MIFSRRSSLLFFILLLLSCGDGKKDKSNKGKARNREPTFKREQRKVPTIDREVSYGGNSKDKAYSIDPTEDGGYVVGGVTYSDDGNGSGAADPLIFKLDDVGEVQWQKNLGSSGGDALHSLQQTDEGGIIVTGTKSGAAWISKLDGKGNMEWEQKRKVWDHGYSIQQTEDGGYVIAGSSRSSERDIPGDGNDKHFWVLKLDGRGSVQWDKAYGGSATDHASSIQQTKDGGYVLAGRSASDDGDLDGNNGYYDLWVLKLALDGRIEWEENYGGSDGDIARSIQQTKGGGYIVAGYSESEDGDVTENYGEEDFWVLKLDPTGSLEWENCYGGSERDEANAVLKTADGGYMVAGLSGSDVQDPSEDHDKRDAWLLKLDASGNIEWEENYGGSKGDRWNSIEQAEHGAYVLAGRSYSEDGDVSENRGGADLWVVKLAADG